MRFESNFQWTKPVSNCILQYFEFFFIFYFFTNSGLFGVKGSQDNLWIMRKKRPLGSQILIPLVLSLISEITNLLSPDHHLRPYKETHQCAQQR